MPQGGGDHLFRNIQLRSYCSPRMPCPIEGELWKQAIPLNDVFMLVLSSFRIWYQGDWAYQLQLLVYFLGKVFVVG